MLSIKIVAGVVNVVVAGVNPLQVYHKHTSRMYQAIIVNGPYVPIKTKGHAFSVVELCIVWKVCLWIEVQNCF